MYSDKIALGSAQFGSDYGISNSEGITPIEEVAEILSLCKENNITTIDTAFGYLKSEEVLGKNDLKEFDIISKFLPESELIPSVKEQLAISLKRLNIPFMYGYLVHRPSYVIKNKHIWDFLIGAKKDKIINKIGFSFNEPSEIDEILKENIIPDLIQVPFNYFDNRFEEKIILLKERYNTEIHIRSVFLQGLFFTDTKQLDDFFNPVKEYIEDLQNKYYPLNAYLLNYVMDKNFVDKVVVGVNNKNQLIENLDGLKLYKKLPSLKIKVDDSILIPSKWPKNSYK